MLHTNDHALPLVVYVNAPDDAHLSPRKQAITTYLADAGIKDQQVRLEYGPNPNATSSAAANLMRLSKTESESPVASNPTNSSASGYGTGGSAGAPSATQISSAIETNGARSERLKGSDPLGLAIFFRSGECGGEVTGGCRGRCSPPAPTFFIR